MRRLFGCVLLCVGTCVTFATDFLAESSADVFAPPIENIDLSVLYLEPVSGVDTCVAIDTTIDDDASRDSPAPERVSPRFVKTGQRVRPIG